MYEKTTHNISIQVTPDYLPDQSRPEEDHYVWSYHVRIENNGDMIVQLKSRYWKITDGNGYHHEVEGEGVVGQQPRDEMLAHFSGGPGHENGSAHRWRCCQG